MSWRFSPLGKSSHADFTRGYYNLVGGLEHFFFPQKYWEFHHPNWRTHIFQRGLVNHQTATFGSPHSWHRQLWSWFRRVSCVWCSTTGPSCGLSTTSCLCWRRWWRMNSWKWWLGMVWNGWEGKLGWSTCQPNHFSHKHVMIPAWRCEFCAGSLTNQINLHLFGLNIPHGSVVFFSQQ